jgi:hypothetical protein
MAESAVQTPGETTSVTDERFSPEGKPKSGWRARDLLRPLASLRLTVGLFALATMLVFCGTLAQVDAGIWTVVRTYFRTAYVWIPFQIFFPRSLAVPGAFLFPGGWLIGGLLLVNVLAAHAVRFKATWKRSGIILLHAGIIVMLVSEAVTGLYAVEGNMTIVEGGASNYVENTQAAEFAVVDASDPEYDDTVVIPESILKKGGRISSELLPFDVDVDRFMVNSVVERVALTILDAKFQQDLDSGDLSDELRSEFAKLVMRLSDDVTVSIDEPDRRWSIHDPKLADPILVAKRQGSLRVYASQEKLQKDQANPASAGAGRLWIATEQPEVSGTDPNQQVDAPSAYVTLREKGSEEPLGVYLLTLHLNADSLIVDGRPYEIDLRFRRTYKPYTLHLIDFKHELYIGTDTPKNFESVVHLVDPEQSEDRQVRIYMNHPLQHAGETFYQSSFLKGDSGTVLQVVRNPGWVMPYLSCAMVSGGMLMHFGMNLFVFLRRRK